MRDQAQKPEAKVKGIGFVGIFKYIKLQPGGERLLESVLAELSPEAQAVCSRKVITVRDYPYPVFVDLLRTADRVIGTGDLSLCEELGQFASNRDYDFFFGGRPDALKPADLFRDCGVYWKSYYTNAGYMKTEEDKQDNAVVRIYDFPEMDPAHCRLMVGWMSRAMELAGARWIEYREEACMFKGDAFHEFWGRWRYREEGQELPKRDFIHQPKEAKIIV